MSETRPDAYALLESSFHHVPKLKSHKPFPRRIDNAPGYSPAVEPLKQDALFLDDEGMSQDTPLASPGLVNGADTGLPPTPPSNSQDDQPKSFSPPAHADGVVTSLMSKKSSISTPVNQRSPPTPDPSPPRTTESMITPERPNLFAYPSSRAESFKTAREDQLSSNGADSRSNTPMADKNGVLDDEPGLGMAFERDQSDTTPINRARSTSLASEGGPVEQRKASLHMEHVPDREWDTSQMRNVTVRRKRNPRIPRKTSQPKNLAAIETATPATESEPRRSSSLRERVAASQSSPRTPSMENFAQSIGWPNEQQAMVGSPRQDAESKRHSLSSTASTVVEVMVIPSPPQTQRKLRHSGKNLAYRRDVDSSDHSSISYSNRNSVASEDIPAYRLIHKRASIAERKKRISSESDTSGLEWSPSPLSVRKRVLTSPSYTLQHQESVKRVLQPAAELINRSNSLSRPYPPERTFHKRISSAPEASKRRERALEPRPFHESFSPGSPIETTVETIPPPRIERTSPSTAGHQSEEVLSSQPAKVQPVSQASIDSPSLNINKSLPELPTVSNQDLASGTSVADKENTAGTQALTTPPVIASEPPLESEPSSLPPNATQEASPPRRASSQEATAFVRRGSLSVRGRSEERRRSSTSQDRKSTSRDTLELPRHSLEWHGMHFDDHRRISFDRSTARTEEHHAMARHLYAQTTPFSQHSDTPIEVSEATAVSIYPHNNQSLLVVQHLARSSTIPLESSEAADRATHMLASDLSSSLPQVQEELKIPAQPEQPILTVEPSTPPMQISLPVPSAVDSPLKNPRQAPEPPSLKVIPPTPAEELERQFPPGPPKRSDSHPQRRLSLVQRARRYSDNFISPILARASSTKGRSGSETHATHENPRVPSINDEESNLHPFWRPRGFWDGFDDSDSDSDDDALPQGGDTSEVVDPPPEPPSTKFGTLSRRLTNGFKGSGGFLIGNSLGVERSGSNRRRHRVELPAKRSAKDEAPKIMIQPPTIPLRPHSPRVEKRGSSSSVLSSSSLTRPRRGSRRGTWRKGKNIPGLGVQVQYIGLSGVKDRLRERKAEKRRNEIRRSIGSRVFMDVGGVNAS
ncbi:hypothetical protein EJ04DRAFT_95711 [Polyplosphaeria fusca]|uniref:Uncharacterized protein n=1 Tax=Polyplosphaeria fusca TaxID=682080 RepID=A0A9P4R1J5_9PLEO|nr:hypothetical protein EJ04DRAFT_95711 [Polyplosphaeria fusca]